MTPAEYYCYLKGYEERELNDLNNTIVSAWYNEFFARQKKLDKISKYLIDYKPKKKVNKIKDKKRMSKEEIEKHYKNKVVR